MTQNLVIGASGLVGSHLSTLLSSGNRKIIATYHKNPIPSAVQLDIKKSADLDKLFARIKPEIVFLPGATPNVDYCEEHPTETNETNVMGVKNVVQSSNRAGARLIYFSSDYIFNGQSGPYSETDPANPINVYGQQKLEAEHYIALFAKDYLIIRTTIVYGWEHQGKNFIYRLIKSLTEGISVKVPVDQIGSPTYVNNLAQIAISLAETSLKGVINITGPSLVNRYEFAKKAAQTFSLDEDLIFPVKTGSLNQSAKRPMKAGLLTTKVSAISTIPIVDYKDGLEMMAKEHSLI